MSKTKEMNEFIDGMGVAMFGRKRFDGQCVFCGSDKINPEDFRDTLSRKEYTISGICQKCQDKTFGV